MQKNSYRTDVDGLRALAILFVLGFHFYPESLPGGFSGVDIFFTISGFLISNILVRELRENRFSIFGFYKRRVLRIFPALLIVVGSTLAFGYLFLFADELAALGKQTFGGLTFISNFLFYNETGYFRPSAQLKPLLHLWSLSVEEQFYVVWPIFLFLLHRLRWLNLTWLSLFTILSFTSNFVIEDANAQFFWPLTRFWQFAVGGCVAIAQKDGHPRWRTDTGSMLAYAGIVLIAFGLYISREDDSLQHVRVLPVILGTVLLLEAGSKTLIAEYFLSTRPLRALGWISYPLYLWHWPLIVFGRVLQFEGPYAKPTMLVMSVALATLTFKFIEGRGRVWGLVLLAIGLAAGGGAIFLSDGRIARVTEEKVGIEYFTGQAPEGSCRLLVEGVNPEDWCDIGNAPERDPDVLLIGDSFSPGYGNVLRQLFRQHPDLNMVYRAYARGRCPSLLGYGPAYCREIVEQIYKYIKKTKSIRTVVFTVNWRRYINGTSYPDENHSETDLSFIIALKASLSAIEASGKKIVVFMEPPAGRAPRYCVDRWSSQFKEGCVSSHQRAELYDQAVRSRLLPFFKGRGTIVFDPWRYFCSDQSCIVLSGKRPLYAYDGLHLDYQAGEFLATNAASELEELFSKSP